ncbi:MAG: ImmA/IrrE family metallo-endopeptidase, partial [Acidobacteriota bacterium]
FARSAGEKPFNFVGSAHLDDRVEATGEDMRKALNFDLEARRDCLTWTDALGEFIRRADASGVLVMVSGVYLNNNHRPLDPQEFRGFAMADDLAPLVFVNGADSKAAQMFTLAHELAHLWLGQSALSDSDPALASGSDVEVWCNQAAAELLAPLKVVAQELRPGEPLETEAQRLERRFKVSRLVMLRRIFDTGRIPLPRAQLQQACDAELKRLSKLPRGGGSDFYQTQAARVSNRFARALVGSTLEGRTLYRDALRMLGIFQFQTFQELVRNLGYST